MLKPGKSLRFAIPAAGRTPIRCRAGSGAFRGVQALQLVLDEAIRSWTSCGA